MCRQLIHIYGPVYIHSYGTMIFLGLLLLFILLLVDPMRKKLINKDQLLDIIGFGLLSGLLGARFLYVLCNFNLIKTIGEIGAIWDGGLSLMGGIIGILLCMPFYLRYKKIPILLCFDIFAAYLPLLQSISRIGCFFAGCCYGTPTQTPFGICCQDLNGNDINQFIHPVQLYSSCMQFLIFLFLFLFRKKIYSKPGQLISLYLVLSSLERFVIDFWRGDREFFPQEMLGVLSIHQIIALIIAGISIAAFFVFSQRKTNINEHI